MFVVTQKQLNNMSGNINLINKLNELFNLGLVRKQFHPELPLIIWNYSVKCQWEKKWNEYPLTLQCRGLVTDNEGNIVAQCLPKFFNLHELEPLGIEIPNESFTVLEKEDGSMIQLFYYQNQWVVSSKGSFTSDHVGWAWDILRQKYQVTLDLLVTNNAMLGHNFVFELITPQGRIVRDYGQTKELFLLAVINKKGKELSTIFDGRDHYFNFPLVKQYNGITEYATLSKMVADDHEGFVVRFNSGFRLKIKGQEYLRLHKAITNLTSYDVWEAYCKKIPFEQFIEPFPDEMFDWIENVWNEVEYNLNQKFEELSSEYWRLNRQILTVGNMPDKDVVEVFKNSSLPFSLLMAYHVDRVNLIVEALLRNCKPELKKCWMNQ